MKKTYRVILSMLSMLCFVFPMLSLGVSAEWNAQKWFFCSSYGKYGPMLYKLKTTDWFQHMVTSKSTTANSDKQGNLYNNILNVAGYEIGRESPRNFFEAFGLSGVNFVSYTGEWKYYDINACDEGDRQIPKMTNFGEFYEGRLDPLSTYEEINNTKDIRTKEFARGRFVAFFKAFQDTFNNTLLVVAKFFFSLTMALFSLSLVDFASTIGIGLEFQQNVFSMLYEKMYQPFMIVMFLMSVGYILYKGLIKGEYRQSLVNGLFKPFLSLFFAVLFYVAPSLLSLPNEALTALQLVIVGSFVENSGDTVDSELCKTYIEESEQDVFKRGSDILRSRLGCKVWEHFIFRPYIKGQFGVDYKELSSLPNVNSRWVGSPRVAIGDVYVENWGLFHLSVMSGKHRPVDDLDTAEVGGVNKDYYRIVDALSNYDEDGMIGFDESVQTSSFYAGGNPSANAKDFFAKYGDFAKKVADEAGVYASVMLAQAALESGYGKYLPADYNFFGIKCGKNLPCGDVVSTQEVYNGQTVTIKDRFRKFDSAEDAFRGYARFLHGEGAGANFSGGFKKNARSPEEAIRNIKAAGYATDPQYVAKIMSIIKTYNLEQYDTANTEATSLENFEGKNTNLSPYAQSSEGIYLPEVKDTVPLKEWDVWIGNDFGTRFTSVVFMIIFSTFGLLGPLLFSFGSLIYNVVFNLLVAMAPIFLLFGLWAGKGESVLVKYLGTLLSVAIKKTVYVFLVILSILIAINTLELVDNVGAVYAFVLGIVMVYVLYKQKERIVGLFVPEGLFRFSDEPARNTKNMIKGVGESGLQIGVAGMIGGMASQKSGGSFTKGMNAAMLHNFRQKLWRTDIGQRANIVYNTISKSRSDLDDKYKTCVDCGVSLGEGTEVFIDENGNYYCDTCASALGYEGMVMTYLDNKNDEHYSMTRDKSSVFIQDESENTKEVKYLTRRELVEKIGHTADTDIVEWEKLETTIQDRIKDSMRILEKDLENAKKEGKTISVPFVPEPIRHFVSYEQAQRLLKNGQYDDYYKMIESAWKKWFVTQRKHAEKITKENKE